MSRLDTSLHDSLSDDILKLLFSNKIYTVIDFINSEVKFIAKKTPLSYKEIIEIRKKILNKYSAKINRGNQIYKDMLENTIILPTNIKSFDKLIDGGLYSGNIYEFCGYAGSGKTQLCLTIALNIAQYLEKIVYYIDTKRDFSGRKLQNILDTRNCSEETSGKTLERIKVKQLNNQYQLINALHEIKNELTDGHDVKMIVIDSLPAIYHHTGDFNDTLININHFVNVTRYLASQFSISFLVVNIMLENRKVNSSDVLCTEKPGLGKYWERIPNYRLSISQNDSSCNSMRQITVLKSLNLASGLTCNVNITSEGVV